jgi:tRNA U34 5-methylaminomethyl-2-thiouridine-forming methyltransferase MnmC
MKRYLLDTEEGIHTVMCDHTGQAFHSKFGSLQESKHVFIDHGLKGVCERIDHASILDVGFGSGLNTLLTLKYLDTIGATADYTAVELYPLQMDLVHRLNFFNYIDRKYRPHFFDMHTCG